MIWRYTIHLEMASKISVWGPNDSLAPETQLVDSRVTSTPTDILPGNPAEEKATLASQTQVESTGWGAPCPETTITGTSDRKCLAIRKKVRLAYEHQSDLGVERDSF